MNYEQASDMADGLNAFQVFQETQTAIEVEKDLETAYNALNALAHRRGLYSEEQQKNLSDARDKVVALQNDHRIWKQALTDRFGEFKPLLSDT